VTRVLPLLAFLAICFPTHAEPAYRVVHVFVALADNQHQGIVPVPAKLGDGDTPSANLYWGAAFGVKIFFRSSPDWKLLFCGVRPKQEIFERCVFESRRAAVRLVADAYQGSRIREAVSDFLAASAGADDESAAFGFSGSVRLPAPGVADLAVYVGHDAFMDFQIAPIVGKQAQEPRQVIILACASKQYFASYLRATGAEPLLWTTNLMAPEAYTLKAALDGWINHENGRAVRDRAAHAYAQYQHCSFAAAQRLFQSGW
jgi:hypothetical protein